MGHQVTAALPVDLGDAGKARRAHELEGKLLGEMLLDTACIRDARVHVFRPDQMVDFAHRVMLSAILGLYRDGKAVDAVTVTLKLAELGQLEEAGGQAYVLQLVGSATAAGNGAAYAQIVAKNAAARDAKALLGNSLGRLEHEDTAEVLADLRHAMDQQWADSEAVTATQYGLDYLRMSDVTMRPVKWLWWLRIAIGKVTMFAGHPGLGKSQITSSLAAITTVAGKWPVDGTKAPLGSVVILSAEDDPEDTIAPRLVAAGADMTRVYVVKAVRDDDGEGGERRRSFDLGRDLAHLGAMLNTIGDVLLVVVDPITAYLGGIDSHRTSDVRALMAPLSEFAERHGTAIVLVSHLNKSKGAGAEAMLRVTGSLAFVAAARAAYVVCKDPDDDTRRILLPAKNNLGDDAGGYAYRIEAATVAGGIQTSRIVWNDEPVSVTADDALAGSGDSEERSERDEAAEWLRTELAMGPVDAKELQGRAKRDGHAWHTLRRARDVAGVTTRREGFGPSGKWVWERIDDTKTPIGDIGGSEKNAVTYGTYGDTVSPMTEEF